MSDDPQTALNASKARLDSLVAEGVMLKERLEAKQFLRRFWPPKNPEVVAPKLAQLITRTEKSAERYRLRAESPVQTVYPESLPVADRREEIVEAIRQHPVVVIAGETGSGKTTQLPKMCLDAGLGTAGLIGCTQPRRVAALSISRRIAEELKVQWGQEVGCKMRFTDETSGQTRIKLMTDGILLNELQNDGLLSEYEAVIIDEAHERSLNIDFILGALQLIRKRRPDLKIIITSATIDTATFSKAFGGAPIIEVSGRTYPVEVEYRPLEEWREESGDFTFIDAAAATVEDICQSYRTGDVLVFMPSERDIRETMEALEKRRLGNTDILPLFGRLSSGEQQRVFGSSQRRKVIVATNIAETSITLPGIRFVVDTGVARISRYSQQSRTQRLPIEKISKSSANQRKGRCGRVAEGLCFRLYSEQDFEGRPQYTDPEILRANLASVILRMIAFCIGEIDTFPFIEPPESRAVRAGYNLLIELGALDDTHQLTRLGKRMADLPVDPTAARMLLEADRNDVADAVLVIAAGISIQDPRERPLEQAAEADQMHRKFVHPQSDFLTLLNIWTAYHDETERLSQNQLRKFCREHFLNYLRMREWRDIHSQLARSLDSVSERSGKNKTKGKQEKPPSQKSDGRKVKADSAVEFDFEISQARSDAIHQSILAGYIGSVAHKDGVNEYQATHSRRAVLFPGSGLYDKKADKLARKTKFKKGAGAVEKIKSAAPDWIVAAHWMETQRLFARTAAKIDSRWIAELGQHLIKHTYTEPAYSPKQGRVQVKEKTFLYGLQIGVRQVAYGKIDPADATSIFIRQGLVEDELPEHFPFLEHNRILRERVESLQTRLRRTSSYSIDERLYQFYQDRLQNVSSCVDLRQLLKTKESEPRFLFLEEADLLEDRQLEEEARAFPESVDLGGQKIPLEYRYNPGQESDGVTLKVSVEQFDALQRGVLDWLVPGYLVERIEGLLRGLPKDVRKQLFPIGEKTRVLASKLQPSHRPLTEELSDAIFREFNIRISRHDWADAGVPEHLLPRVEVVDQTQSTIAAGRDWEAVAAEAKQRIDSIREGKAGGGDHALWRSAREQWEREDVVEWTFGDLPDEVKIGDLGGIPVLAYPALKAEENGLAVRLLKSREEAIKASRMGYRKLVERALGRDFAWLEKDLKGIRKFGPLLAMVAPADELREQAFANIRNHLCLTGFVYPLKHDKFRQTVLFAQRELKTIAPAMLDRLGKILEARNAALSDTAQKRGYPGMQQDILRIVPPDFVKRTPYTRLAHLPRYLKAMQLRAERFRQFPQKDAEKAKRLQPWLNQLSDVLKNPDIVQRKREDVMALFWSVEEFRVAVFAQELGTAEKVSEKRLSEAFASLAG